MTVADLIALLQSCPHQDAFVAIKAAKDEIDIINAGLAAALRYNALEQYIIMAVQGARLSKLEDDAGWFAEIVGFPGVWADGASPEASRATLAEVLRDWLRIKLAAQDPDIPVVANIDLLALAPVAPSQYHPTGIEVVDYDGAMPVWVCEITVAVGAGVDFWHACDAARPRPGATKEPDRA